MTDALVVADHRRGRVHAPTYEAITAAAELSDDKVRVAVVGGNGETLASSLDRADVNTIHLLSGGAEVHHTEHYRGIKQLLTRIDEPTHLVIPHTANGVDYAPAVATALDRPIVTDVTDIEETDPLKLRRRWYASKLEVSIELNDEPAVVTVRPDVWSAASGTGTPAVTHEDITSVDDSAVTIDGFQELGRRDPSAERAAALVVVGRGINDTVTFRGIERIAELIDGVIVGTRPAIDAGWVPRHRQVGQAIGSSKVCLTVGVDGDRGALADIRRAEVVIAVNADSGAPVFEVADQAIVGEPAAVVKALVERLETATDKT